MGDRDNHAVAELAALIEADLRASGALTVEELRQAAVESVMSLTKPTEVSEGVYDPDTKTVSFTVTRPRLPGQ